MLKIELLVGVVVFALWVYCLVDVLGSRDDEVRGLPKLGWFVVVLLFPLAGSLVWLVAGRPQAARPARSAYERPAPAFPEYDRPGRATASSPEADEDFLRQVRARAEEQRRRYRAERDAERRAEDEDPGTDPDGGQG